MGLIPGAEAVECIDASELTIYVLLNCYPFIMYLQVALVYEKVLFRPIDFLAVIPDLPYDDILFGTSILGLARRVRLGCRGLWQPSCSEDGRNEGGFVLAVLLIFLMAWVLFI